MFKVGDKVVYPMHGAGVIVALEEKRILGEEHKYYVLKMPLGDMKVMIPTNNAAEIGVRNIATPDEADEAIESFMACIDEDNSNWNKRYRDNIEKLKAGNLIEIACLTKSLLIRERRKSLSNGEKKMFNNAKNILLSELVLAKNTDYDYMEGLLFEANK